MGVLNYAQARVAYGPSCTPNTRAGAQEAWDACSAVMQKHGYMLRAGDTGSRNCRNATGSNLKSMHAFYIACTILLWNLGRRILGGVACDFNWQTNPYGARLVTDMPRAMVDEILAIRTNNGVRCFMWGGYWSGNKDAMHYDLVCHPSDLATGINPATVPGASTPPQPEPEPEPPEEEMPKHRLIQPHPHRIDEMPEEMRDTSHSYYTDGREFWWAPTPGHIALQFALGLAQNVEPDHVSPSFFKELRPRSSFDLKPGTGYGTGGFAFFTQDGKVHPGTWD